MLKSERRTMPRNPSNPIDQIAENADVFVEHLAIDPYLVWRIMAIRLMLDHRGISRAQVTRATGRSKKNREWLSRLLRPGYAYYGPDPLPINRARSDLIHRGLDDVEAAITTLTDRAGGVYSKCTCTTLAIQTIKSELAHVHDEEVE
jgi:hypothetical protein